MVDFIESKIMSLALNLESGPCSGNTISSFKGSLSLGKDPAVEMWLITLLFFAILWSSGRFLLACWTTHPYMSDCCCTKVWHVVSYRRLTQTHTDCHRSENKLGARGPVSQLVAEGK